MAFGDREAPGNGFGPQGNLRRTTSALVVVDGVDIRIASNSRFSSVEQDQIKAQAKVGFFPFFAASASGGWSNDVEFDQFGEITMTSSSPVGNPQVIGAIVTPISATLAAPE